MAIGLPFADLAPLWGHVGDGARATLLSSDAKSPVEGSDSRAAFATRANDFPPTGPLGVEARSAQYAIWHFAPSLVW